MARVANRRSAHRADPGDGVVLTPRKRGLPDIAESQTEDEDEGEDLDPQTPTKRQRTSVHQPLRPGLSARQNQQRQRPAEDEKDPYDYDSVYDVPPDDKKEHKNHRQHAAVAVLPAETSPRKRGRPKKQASGDEDGGAVEARTPTAKRRQTTTFATPTKAFKTAAATPRRAMVDTPMRRSLADRSARRKSTRALIDRAVAGDDEDDEELEDRIFGVEEEDEEDEEEDDENMVEGQDEDDGEEQDREQPVVVEPVTPRRRGRPPKAKKDETATPGAGAEAAVAAGEASPVKRRGPGRPRKDQTAAGAAQSRRGPPTPPRDLPAHEHFFFQNNKAGAAKTSNNTLAGLTLLTHEEYFQLQSGDGGGGGTAHETEVRFLEDLHAQSFAQWAFELAQGFGVCLYGYGSKRRVLRAFARALYAGSSRRGRHANRIVMVDGWAAGGGIGGGRGTSTTAASASASAAALRDILGAVAAAAVSGGNGGDADDADNADNAGHQDSEAVPHLPAVIPAAERALLTLLDGTGSGSTTGPTVTLIINGIDAPALRRPAAQATLARVAAHARVRLLCAADTPGFALLWDGAARAALNLVFHDTTTFRALVGDGDGAGAAEASMVDAVDEVHALLGRRIRRVGGKDGAAFVLRSLPENARSLFQLLVGEALAAGGGGGGRGQKGRRVADEYDDDDDDDGDGDGRDEYADGLGDEGESAGLEYRMLYNKAVEEFICSSEMAFRTLLKEFHDHQMVTSRKDAFGTELLSLPFRRDELEALLEDLMS